MRERDRERYKGRDKGTLGRLNIQVDRLPAVVLA
jgi:hypothetical protein